MGFRLICVYADDRNRRLSFAIAVDFLSAGSSALLLLLARVFPAYWYLSLIALGPFLYRSRHFDKSSASRLGFILGVCSLTVSGIDNIVVTPLLSSIKILGGTALFTLFGWVVGWVNRRLGFNPLVVALLWVAFEAGLLQIGLESGLLSAARFSSSFFHSAAALFGLLIVALLIVLINSLLIVALDAAVSIARARGHVSTEGKKNWDLILLPGLVTQELRLVPEGRGPPTGNMWI